MSPVGAIFVPFSLKMGTNMLHPLPPQSWNVGCYPPDFFLLPQRTLRMTAYASRRRRRPHLFVCVMLLVTVTLGTIKRSLRDVIGPDDCPINYVATLAAFLARLRLQKSDISPSKTQSYPRESNFWATSSLRMVSVLKMTKSLPCLAFLCLRTSKSPAAYVMVLLTTSRLCLT